MTQQNHVAVLHSQQEELYALDTSSILLDLIAASDSRGSILRLYATMHFSNEIPIAPFRRIRVC